MTEILENLKRFATQHGVNLEEKGECGFGRPCVGFTKRESYIAHNPLDAVEYEPIPGFEDEDLYAPDGVEYYHKHDCLAVLVYNDDYEDGLRQLNQWVVHLEQKGTVEIVEYQTGATGLQALATGTKGLAIRFKEKF